MKHFAHTLLAMAILSGTAYGQTSVTIEEPWVRGTVAQQSATGAFMRITPSAPARLVAAESPVAGIVEIHEMAMENDIMKMRQIAGLDLPSGKPTELKPGGYHVMLMALKKPLKAGELVPVTLIFEDKQKKPFSQTVQAAVRPLGQGKGDGPMKGHHHH